MSSISIIVREASSVVGQKQSTDSFAEGSVENVRAWKKARSSLNYRPENDRYDSAKLSSIRK